MRLTATLGTISKRVTPSREEGLTLAHSAPEQSTVSTFKDHGRHYAAMTRTGCLFGLIFFITLVVSMCNGGGTL